MLITINSINDLSIQNLESATVVLLLNANKENYNHVLQTIEFIEYPELILCMPENEEDIERDRRKILQEINTRCKKRSVVSPNSIIVFKIIDGRANFRAKRAINIESAISHGIVNDSDELINLVCFAASKSFEELDKEIRLRIDQGKKEISISVEFNPASPIKINPKISRSKEISAIFNLIVSK